MNHLTELFYSTIESLIITGFIYNFFESKNRYSQKITAIISFSFIFIFSSLMTVVNLSWIETIFLFLFLLIGILEYFYEGKLWEHILTAITVSILLALIDVCVLTLMSEIIGIEYSELVIKNSLSRFLAVIITKIIYLFLLSIIIFFKKRYSLMLHHIELLMISFTLIVSIILISLVRNVIYEINGHYNEFLVILLCVLLLNIVQYYIVIYISKKNIAEKNISLMHKQIEMQEDNIHNLEKQYDEITKIRHDMKNYLYCALNLAKQGDNNAELIKYLENLSKNKIDKIIDYVQVNRKILSIIINSKIGTAKNKNINIQCMVMSELENISDIDVGILIANLLDNAIEACEKNKKESEIILKLWSNAGYYCINIMNTVETDVLINNPHLVTSKKNKMMHGIGLNSVKDIVQKYNGMINFEQKSNRFYVYVSLSKCIL
ncbi:MAG: GHKL domain-containing protein [Ruminococcus sp.]|nr:GHKL domain-containing protein [Ruminococcus sp.]